MYNAQKRRFPSQTSPSTSSVVCRYCVTDIIKSIQSSSCTTALDEIFTLCRPRSIAIRIPRPAKFQSPLSEFFSPKRKGSHELVINKRSEKGGKLHTSPNSAHESRSNPAAISLEGSLMSGIANVQAASMYSCGLRAGAVANLYSAPRDMSVVHLRSKDKCIRGVEERRIRGGA